MRLIGLDHGERRIGVAVGDTETGMAFARPAIRRRSLDAAVEDIARLQLAEDARRIVVGLPLNMDGSEGPQAARARAFGDALARIGVEIVFADERLTSWAAREELGAGERRPDRSSGELDSTAAKVLLQQYLDALQRAPSQMTDPAEETA